MKWYTKFVSIIERLSQNKNNGLLWWIILLHNEDVGEQKVDEN